MRVFLLALFVALPFAGRPSDLPSLTFPNGVGVNIHFVQGHEKDLDLIAQAGFRFVRMDFGWAGIEREKGQYDWSGYEQLLGNLEKRGLRAVLILDYSNPLYEETVTSQNPITGEMHKNTASPQHPESVAAYARWAAAATGHFRGRHVVWEIWNEPNIHFWSPKPDSKQYIAMALEACKAIRKTDPTATLVGPATSGFPWDFLEDCFKSGLLEYWDAVSVHPYREYRHSPETAGTDYSRLREMIDRYAPRGKAGLPILSGEWGYATHEKGVSLETQAAFIVRQQLYNWLMKVPLSIWYDWKNDGDDPKEREHNFGTVFSDLSPKPSWTAVHVLTSELAGYHLKERLPVGGEKDFVLSCTNSTGMEKLIYWTAEETHGRTVTVEIKGGKEGIFSGKTGDGKNFSCIADANNRVELRLEACPTFLSTRATTASR